MKKPLIAIILIVLTVLAGPAQAVAQNTRSVTVFAAASLQGVLEPIGAAYGASVVVSYGGSAAIARQVASGAPADLVILANADWMDWLTGAGALEASSRVDLLANQLVLVGPVGADPVVQPDDIADRLGMNGRLALGQTRAVPAGIYGREWLKTAGVWPLLESRLAETENVRAALALVARGETPLGVVYASDAAAEPRVSVVYLVPKEAHSPIRYPAAIVIGRDAQAHDFMSFLQSETAAKIFTDKGFIPLEAK